MAKAAKISNIRNMGFIAHIDAGKTTTTERVLYYTGTSHRLGGVDDGNTTTDWMDQERERGITITSAAITVEWQGCQINIIDTPGHVDFTAEVERCLRVLDGVVVVLCGRGGVEPQSEMVWRQAERYRVPRMIFINKMDRIGADFERVLKEIRETLNANPLPLYMPIGAENRLEGIIDLYHRKAIYWDQDSQGEQYSEREIPADLVEEAESRRLELMETIASEDDELLEKFLENEDLEPADFYSGVRQGVIKQAFVPVFTGAALRNVGVQPLMDGIVRFLPDPTDVPSAQGENPETGEIETREADPKAPAAAFVFKTYTNSGDGGGGRTNFIRVYSGRLAEGEFFFNSRLGDKERIARLYRAHADKKSRTKEVSAGDICIATGLKLSRTGDTLTDLEHPLSLEAMKFPEPVVMAALEARTTGDEEKLQLALGRLSQDDPTFQVSIDENTGQTIIRGMGELHLQVLEERLVREFNLKIRLGKPQVTYRETVTLSQSAEYTYQQTTGGRDHFGHVGLTVAPLGRGKGFQFINQLGEDVIPPEYLFAIEQAINDAMGSGIRYGYPILDLEVTLTAGTSHETDASGLAFRNAATTAFREACRNAEPIMLEPIMRLEIICPSEFVGAVHQQIASRRGRIIGSELRDDIQILKALAPLSLMFGYATDLRSGTQGRGSFSMVFELFDKATGGSNL
jgi:elongation factor G